MTDDQSRARAARRTFLKGSLATLGAVLWGTSSRRGFYAVGDPPQAPSPGEVAGPGAAASARTAVAAPTTGTAKVVEAWYVQLRADDGAISRQVLDDAVLGLLQITTGDYPLDALASLFPDDPPVSVRVDARSGRPETTAVLATRLAEALRDAGIRGDSIAVEDITDADLKAGGYRPVREGEGPLFHGDDPAPGYGEPRDLPGLGKKVRLARALDDRSRRIAVLARLYAREGRMGPFVLDAALRAFDERTRKKAQDDPELGARLLASPLFGGRVGLVIGDLFTVDLGSPAPGRAADGASESTPASPLWNADELLTGSNLFAVERIGHTILSNACKARGRGPVPEPPLLAAASGLGLHGARLSTIGWKKVSL